MNVRVSQQKVYIYNYEIYNNNNNNDNNKKALTRDAFVCRLFLKLQQLSKQSEKESKIYYNNILIKYNIYQTKYIQNSLSFQ